ncbi:hypothetical protein DFJ58DRAFT_832861, partial [Suillus subalutaceus]|uniref:uncharacterized protein n=1 Tax=Suillus subalutaceus TaxID=48586 RepID=UPI001B87684E
INPKTGEPFLRLAAPHQKHHYHPTSTGRSVYAHADMNDPAIYGWIGRTPQTPYLPEDADLLEVKEDGTDVLIGDVNFRRIERKRLREDNAKASQAGDPTIQYAIGDWIAVSHHGRGIMTAAIASEFLRRTGFVNRGLFDNGKIVRGEKQVLTLLEWKHDQA